MRYHIWTEGCQMNEADSEKLAAGLAKLGWEEAAKANEADLAVVNTFPVPDHPIGIAYEPTHHRIWVACYSGAILVYDA